MIDRMRPASAGSLDEAQLLAQLTTELHELKREGKVSHEAMERELLWLAVILSSASDPALAGAAGAAPLARLCRLVREDASRLRRESEVLREVAHRERSKAARRRRAGLRVLDGGALA